MTIHESFKINLDYLNTIVELVNWCNKFDVKVCEFGTLNNGLFVKFEGVPGDAVIHDFSYGHEQGMLETYKMLWDAGDVSVHHPKDLARLLEALVHNEDWEEIWEET